MTNHELLDKAQEIRDKIWSRRQLSNHSSLQIGSVKISRQNNFTIAVINDRYVGIAKRNPKDKDNTTVGETLALYRAIKQESVNYQ